MISYCVDLVEIRDSGLSIGVGTKLTGWSKGTSSGAAAELEWSVPTIAKFSNPNDGSTPSGIDGVNWTTGKLEGGVRGALMATGKGGGGGKDIVSSNVGGGVNGGTSAYDRVCGDA